MGYSIVNQLNKITQQKDIHKKKSNKEKIFLLINYHKKIELFIYNKCASVMQDQNHIKNIFPILYNIYFSCCAKPTLVGLFNSPNKIIEQIPFSI